MEHIKVFSTSGPNGEPIANAVYLLVQITAKLEKLMFNNCTQLGYVTQMLRLCVLLNEPVPIECFLC